jgi:hypothetical protein
MKRIQTRYVVAGQTMTERDMAAWLHGLGFNRQGVVKLLSRLDSGESLRFAEMRATAVRVS